MHVKILVNDSLNHAGVGLIGNIRKQAAFVGGLVEQGADLVDGNGLPTFWGVGLLSQQELRRRVPERSNECPALQVS
jgi:hypothetical protein